MSLISRSQRARRSDAILATSDMGYAETRIGPDRIKGAYAWASAIGCVFGAPHALRLPDLSRQE